MKSPSPKANLLVFGPFPRFLLLLPRYFITNKKKSRKVTQLASLSPLFLSLGCCLSVKSNTGGAKPHFDLLWAQRPPNALCRFSLPISEVSPAFSLVFLQNPGISFVLEF